MASDLNVVAVPMHMVRSLRDCLRTLSDVCGRRAMRRTVADARRMAMGLDRLAQEQSFPWERVVVKAQLTKATHRDWQQAGREEQFQKLYQEQVLPAFRRLDAHHSGRGRFHLILTFTEA